jgi:hypothetical protein
MKRFLLLASVLGGVALLPTGPAAATTISVNPLLANSSFELSTGASCPTSWACGGSPGSGFGVYAPSSAQYTPLSDGLPFSLVTPSGTNAAYSPTGLSGSGTVAQSTTTTYAGGSTLYTFDFWVGQPKTEPDGTTTVSAFPQTAEVEWLESGTTDNLCGNGSAKLTSLTGAASTTTVSGGGGCVFAVPTPGSGKWQEWELSYTATYQSSGTVGVAFFVSTSNNN